eukprot:g6380.t1
MKDWVVTGICLLYAETWQGFVVGAVLVGIEASALARGLNPRWISISDDLKISPPAYVLQVFYAALLFVPSLLLTSRPGRHAEEETPCIGRGGDFPPLRRRAGYQYDVCTFQMRQFEDGKPFSVFLPSDDQDKIAESASAPARHSAALQRSCEKSRGPRDLAKAKALAAAPPAAAAGGLPEALRLRLPFMALAGKLQGHMIHQVKEIQSLVSEGVPAPQPLIFGAAPPRPAPLPLEQQRERTQNAVNKALELVQGWHQRECLLQCLRSVEPLDSFAATWHELRRSALQRCDETRARLAEVSGDHAVLLEFIGGGYGANVAAAWVMPQEDWNAFKDYVRQKPAESISNESPVMPVDVCLGLSLLNVALESGGDEIARSDELIAVIQDGSECGEAGTWAKKDQGMEKGGDDICKSLLHNSRTASLSVLSLTLRAIFNLFLHFKRHLKVQLEIFFTSVHLKIAGCGTASYEQRELALESLVEFCREPSLMLELYENYDCDVRCTNLFETLVKFLVTHAVPEEARGNFTSLHKLAFSGLLSILHALALRCASHKHFHEQLDLEPTTPPSGETELQRKKDQKRRLTIAARTFNSEPSKSTGALQGLGLLSNPLTPESMAEFLRHTPGLDMNIVGEFLGKRHDFNGQVRKAFLDTFPFAGLGLVEALRLFLATFRLPGEAQCIERLMESFAEAYFRSQPVADGAGAASEEKPQNPLAVTRWVPRERSEEADRDARDAGRAGGPEDGAGEERVARVSAVNAMRQEPTRVPMASSDTIFILAFSIIMLNTDLHNPGVKKKMCLEEFVRNNRGIDTGKDLPQYFLSDIFEAIRDDEIRLHGASSSQATDDQVIDDFFWEGILLRSESIDAFSTTERLLSEAPPGSTERDMLQVLVDCQPMPMLTLCYESIPDAAVAMQAMMGFQDLARISAYFDQMETVSGLVRTIFQYCSHAAAGGTVSVRCQIALGSAEQCVAHFGGIFREAEWRGVLEVLLQLWALDLLPPHLSEFDDFSGTDGKPLESLCNIRPLYPPPAASATADAGPSAICRGRSVAESEDAGPAQATEHEGDGFLESLARWFEDETRDDEEEDEAFCARPPDLLLAPPLPGKPKVEASAGATPASLPVDAADPGTVHQKVKQYVAKSGFVEVLSSTGMGKLPTESLQGLAKALVQLSRPSKWFAQAEEAQASGAAAEWHEVADPVFCLELLTNITCMPLPASNLLSHIWPLVSTHFERLLQDRYVIAGHGTVETQFIERLIVNTLRLCIRLIGNAELVPTLLTLMQYLSKLPGKLFSAYSERIACGILVLVQEATLPHSGLCNIFSLLSRISEFPAGVGACSAGIECLNFWLSDDQESNAPPAPKGGRIAVLLSLQQLPELLKTLKAFAQGSCAPAALGHLSSLVPQLARGARCLPPEAQSQWRSLWVPTLQALADIAREGSQRASAEAFVYLQRLLLETSTDLALPWEELEFAAWKECLEQVLFPLLQAPSRGDGMGDMENVLSSTVMPCRCPSVLQQDVAALRQANAAQLVCRVLLTHMSQWLKTSPARFSVLFLRLLHILVSEATVETSREPLVESLKNLLLVISADPAFGELSSPKQGETLLEAAWGVVAPSLPELRREVSLILDPSAVEPGEVPESPPI